MSPDQTTATGAQNTEQPGGPPDVLPPVEVAAPPPALDSSTDEHLAAMHALYAEKEAAAKAAKDDFETVKAAIKVALSTAYPGEAKVELRGEAGPPLRLVYVESSRFDSRRFKADQPAVHDAYLKTSGSWTLKLAGGGA